MKTAVSIPDDLFEEMERVAKEKHSSRSEVFATALREYLERRKSAKLLEKLNQAFAVEETPEEYKARQGAKKRYRSIASRERS